MHAAGTRCLAAIGFVALVMGLGACTASGVRRNDDGTLSIQCSGGYHDWSQCYRRAASVCRPDGVDIVSQVSNEGSAGVGTRDWSSEGSEVSRTLVVRCTGDDSS